jgi:hypothetical protein
MSLRLFHTSTKVSPLLRATRPSPLPFDRIASRNPASAYIHKASRLQQPLRISKSSINWAPIATVLVTGAVIWTAGYYQGYNITSRPSQPPAEAPIDVTLDEMPTQLLGRPGNLTPDEEAKLRELWNLMLQVTGVISAPSTPNDSSSQQSSGLSRVPSEDNGTPEKKKSRLSFLKKKNKHEGVNGSHAPLTSATNAQSSPASGACHCIWCEVRDRD